PALGGGSSSTVLQLLHRLAHRMRQIGSCRSNCQEQLSARAAAATCHLETTLVNYLRSKPILRLSFPTTHEKRHAWSRRSKQRSESASSESQERIRLCRCGTRSEENPSHTCLAPLRQRRAPPCSERAECEDLQNKKPSLTGWAQSAKGWCLDIQVLHVERVLFDELAA